MIFEMIIIVFISSSELSDALKSALEVPFVPEVDATEPLRLEAFELEFFDEDDTEESCWSIPLLLPVTPLVVVNPFDHLTAFY